MKILFLAGHEFISDQKNGGRQCSNRNYNLLKTIYGEDNIHIVTFSNNENNSKYKNVTLFPKHKNRVQQMWNAIWLRNGYSAVTEKKVTKYINSLGPDIIFFDHSFTGFLLKKIKHPKCVIVFMHNIEKDHVWDKVKKQSILYIVPYFSYFLNERFLVHNADKIINLNYRDKNRLNKIYKKDSDFLLPITYDDRFDETRICKKTSKKNKLLFIGSLFGPNIDGLKWFVHNVLNKLNNTQVIAIGNQLESLRGKINHPQLDIIGTVDDTDTYYYSVDAVVLPIFYGNGMKTKTAEAMMFGKTIFATDEALVGYQFENMRNIHKCNSVEDFVNAINKHFIDKGTDLYDKDIRQEYLNHYCTKNIAEKFKKFMDSV